MYPKICAILIDLSGTLHIGNTPTPGAVDALKKLRKSGVPFRFCSNTSKEGTGEVVGRLKGMGFEINGVREVWTSVGAIGRRVEEPYMLLSSSAQEEVKSYLPSRDSDSKSGDDEPFDAVLVGLAPDLFDYTHLNTAFRILVGEDSPSSTPRERRPPLIATHKSRYMETNSPPGLSLGPGAFVEALEYASGVKAEAMGKPTRRFFETVASDFTEDEREGKVVVVGDDVESDLGGGAGEMEMWRVLVKTGKYRPGDETREGVVPPDETFDTFADFVESVIEDA